jgi:hypothetical protein
VVASLLVRNSVSFSVGVRQLRVSRGAVVHFGGGGVEVGLGDGAEVEAAFGVVLA